MRKKVIKWFVDGLGAQERWLNRMSAQGWRLVAAGSCTYTFEACEPQRYRYGIRYTGGMSETELKAYQASLARDRVHFFSKGLNLGKLSYGHRRWRPNTGRGGASALSLARTGSELLIVETEAGEGAAEAWTLEGSGRPDNRYRYYSDVLSLLVMAGLMLTLVFFLTGPFPHRLFSQRPASLEQDYRWLFKAVNLAAMLLCYRWIWRISGLKREAQQKL